MKANQATLRDRGMKYDNEWFKAFALKARLLAPRWTTPKAILSCLEFPSFELDRERFGQYLERHAPWKHTD